MRCLPQHDPSRLRRRREEWPIADCDSLQQRKAARPELQTSRYCFRRLRAQPFWSPSDAGDQIARLCGALEASFNGIEEEALALLQLLSENEEDAEDTEDAKDGAD